MLGHTRRIHTVAAMTAGALDRWRLGKRPLRFGIGSRRHRRNFHHASATTPWGYLRDAGRAAEDHLAG